MAEFMLGVFASPLILFGTLWAGLAWWSWIIFVGGLAVVESCVYRDSDGWAVVWLAGLFFLITYILVPIAPETGFFAEVWLVIKATFVAVLDYVILGMMAALPLWFWDVRKRLVHLRFRLYEFVQERSKSSHLWSETYVHEENKGKLKLTDEQVAACEQYNRSDDIPDFLVDNWAEYRRDKLHIEDGSTKLINNVDTISSYIFLWPFHYITLFFGDFLAKIPEWFVRYFGRLVDACTRIVRVGIPSNIDG